MGAERFWSAVQAPGEAANPTAQFHPTSGVAIDAQIPDTQTTRVVRYDGEIYSAGPMAQLEVWMGGAGGATWGRVNVLMTSPGWQKISGAFRHVNTQDPERVILRCRSYQPGADAKLRGCRVDGLDVAGLTYGDSWLPDADVGENTDTTETIPAGQTAALRTVGLSGIAAGQYRVCCSCEVDPNGGVAQLQLFGDGHLLASWDVPGLGLHERMIGVAPMHLDTVDAGSRVWELRCVADGAVPTRVRRAGLFVVNWDEVTA